MSEYPFLFYGHAPSEWAEGANAGHFWEIRFVRPGTEAQLCAAGRAWAEALAGSPVATVDWQFAGSWALVRCGEDSSTGGDHHAKFFAAVEKAMRAVHAALPIAEVVLGNGRGGGAGPWDRWSHTTQAWPSAYPNFADYTRFYGATMDGYVETFGDPSLGTGTKNAAFDEAMNDVWRRQSKAEVATTATKDKARAKKKGKGLVFEAVDPGEIDRLMGPERAAAAELGARLEALGFAKARPRLATRAGRVITWEETAPREQRLVYAEVADAAMRRPELPIVKGWIDAVLSPDEEHVLVLQRDNLVASVCSTNGESEREVFRATTKRGLNGGAWVAADRVVIAAEKQLHLVPIGRPPVATTTASKSPQQVWSCRGGAVLIVSTYAERLEVWEVRGDELVKLGDAKGAASAVVEHGGAVFVAGAPWRRIDGLS